MPRKSSQLMQNGLLEEDLFLNATWYFDQFIENIGSFFGTTRKSFNKFLLFFVNYIDVGGGKSICDNNN